MKEALQLLSDDDPEKDIDGYLKLFGVLAAAGHDSDAIGILEMICIVTNEEMSKSAELKNQRQEEIEKCSGNEGDEGNSNKMPVSAKNY